MNAPESGRDSPAGADSPVFAEPWQAAAFALAVRLSAAGCFTWSEWAEELSRQIAAGDGSDYYRNWVAALERLLVERHIATADALQARREAWEEAYRRTPHGRPVRL